MNAKLLQTLMITNSEKSLFAAIVIEWIGGTWGISVCVWKGNIIRVVINRMCVHELTVRMLSRLQLNVRDCRRRC